MFRKLSTSVAIIALVASPDAYACTRILWNEGGPAVLVARTMDWPESTQPILTVLPGGLPHDGGKVGAETCTIPIQKSGRRDTAPSSPPSMDSARPTG